MHLRFVSIQFCVFHRPLSRAWRLLEVKHSLKFIEQVYGEKITPANAEEAVCTTIARTCDMTRHVVIPDELETYTEKDEDGFIYRVSWNTKNIVERPFETVEEARDLVKKDIDRIRGAIEEKKFCHQAKWHLKLFEERFDEPEELNEEFKRIQNKMDGTVIMAPEFFDGIGPMTTRYNYDMFIFLYNDYPELIHELLDVYCDYQLFRIGSFAGPGLSPVALMGTAVSGVGGLIFPPEFLIKEFFPFARKIVDKLHELGYKVIFEMEGDVKQVFDEIVNTGTDAYGTVEELSGMTPVWIKARHPKLVVTQMIDSVQFLTHGKKEDVISKTEEMIELARKYGGIFIGSSGDINEEVNVENALAMIETVRNASMN